MIFLLCLTLSFSELSWSWTKNFALGLSTARETLISGVFCSLAPRERGGTTSRSWWIYLNFPKSHLHHPITGSELEDIGGCPNGGWQVLPVVWLLNESEGQCNNNDKPIRLIMFCMSNSSAGGTLVLDFGREAAVQTLFPPQNLPTMIQRNYYRVEIQSSKMKTISLCLHFGTHP